MMEKNILELNESILKDLYMEFGVVGVKSYTLAEPVLVRDVEQDVTIPAIVDENGDCFNMFDNADGNDIVFYHRISQSSYSEKSGYGSRAECVLTANVSLVVYGKRHVGRDRVLDTIASTIINTKDANMVSIDYDSIQILASEYSGLPYFLSPDYFIARLNYRITKYLVMGCKK